MQTAFNNRPCTPSKHQSQWVLQAVHAERKVTAAPLPVLGPKALRSGSACHRRHRHPAYERAEACPFGR
jgi:hypothetical protein